MCFEEQIVSKDKYPSLYLPQNEAILFIILQIFFTMRSFENWGISLGYSPGFVRAYFVK